jgi:EF hand
MKFAIAAASATVLGLALAAGAHADTRNSNDKTTMEQRASPSGPKLDEERAESTQGQPGVPSSIGGATVRDTPKDKAKPGKRQRPDQASSSSGSSAPSAQAGNEQAFKRLDLDGDGSISKAEAAGYGKLMNEFDGADRNHDGKLSRAEYDRRGDKPDAKPKTRTAKAKAQVK